MNKLLTICLLSLSISSTALATEAVQGSADWLSQNSAPKASVPTIGPQPSSAAVTVSEASVEIPEGSDIQEALDLGMQMLDAINSGKMQLVLGMLLMMLIWGLRTFWESFSPNAVPWITASIATVGAVAVGMISGWPWERIITDALTISTSAGGLWSLIGKHISNLGK